LNLKSKGNWVSCHIGPPDGYDVGGIDPSSIQITQISINGVDSILDPPISVAPGAPLKAGDKKLKVKFIRYDKSNPDNPQSLTKVLTDLLAGETGKFYQATLTVQGAADGQSFEGTDTIKVKNANGKKGKK
jgi:hypothetical protein